MPKLDRRDTPGSWHYVTNKGLHERFIFKRPADARYFLAQLAKIHRRGLLEIHAYSVLTTCFRLLVCSREGRLSEALRILQRSYVNWFKRNYHHRGSLFEKRFYSYRIEDEALWIALVRSIDQVSEIERIEARGRYNLFGSALHYQKTAGPPWLTRGAIEARCHGRKDGAKYEPIDYFVPFGLPINYQDRRLIRQALHYQHASDFPFHHDFREELLAAPENTLMQRLLSSVDPAGSARPRTPARETVIRPASIQASIRELARYHPNWIVRPHRHRKPGWKIMEAGLLRMLGGLRYREIGPLIKTSEVKARRWSLFHERLLREDPGYLREAALVSRKALQLDRPDRQSEKDGDVEGNDPNKG